MYPENQHKYSLYRYVNHLIWVGAAHVSGSSSPDLYSPITRVMTLLMQASVSSSSTTDIQRSRYLLTHSDDIISSPRAAFLIYIITQPRAVIILSLDPKYIQSYLRPSPSVVKLVVVRSPCRALAEYNTSVSSVQMISQQRKKMRSMLVTSTKYVADFRPTPAGCVKCQTGSTFRRTQLTRKSKMAE